MTNYKTGKIYCIRSHQTDKIYIGSTTQSLSKRMYSHKSNNGTKYGSKADLIIKYNDCYIELIKDYPCDTRQQLLAEEGNIIRSTPNCVNKCMLFVCKKDYNKHYRNLYRDELNKKCKEYHKENKKRIQKYQKEYIVCECGFKVQRASMARHKRTKRHKKLIQGLPLTNFKVFLCECGCTVSNKNKTRHLISKKHLNILAQN